MDKRVLRVAKAQMKYSPELVENVFLLLMFADSTSYLLDERWGLAQPASINKLYTYTEKNNPKNYFTGNYGLLHYVLSCL